MTEVRYENHFCQRVDILISSNILKDIIVCLLSWINFIPGLVSYFFVLRYGNV